MAVLSSAVLAPAITYGSGLSIYYDTSSAISATNGYQVNYRVNYLPTPNNTNTTNTLPTNWHRTTTVELDIPYCQYTQGNINTTCSIYYGDNSIGYFKPKTAAERLKEILNSRMAPNVLTTCRPLGYTQDIREMRARETLRRVLGEDKFRDFVRRGSVSVRAKSGLVYQIFPGGDITKVYDSGKMIERLCVVLMGGFPPTDSLIMRYLMILNNEQQFRSYAIKHNVYAATLPMKSDQRTLVEIFKELKKVA